MQSPFAKWCASFFICLFCSISLFGEQRDDWSYDEDISLVLPDYEPEKLVSITGQLLRHTLNKDPEIETLGTFSYWVIKMDPKSFEISSTTPVRCAFQTSQSIRNNLKCQELELTGNYDEKWLHEHEGQIITLTGYLWHAHTAHHHTPVMMDRDTWLKENFEK